MAIKIIKPKNPGFGTTASADQRATARNTQRKTAGKKWPRKVGRKTAGLRAA